MFSRNLFVVLLLTLSTANAMAPGKNNLSINGRASKDTATDQRNATDAWKWM
jgi:hypothetical protein